MNSPARLGPVLAGLSAIVAACAPADPLGLPAAPQGTRTMILALDHPGCESGTCDFVRVYRDSVVDEALTLPTGMHRLYALYYSSTPEELMIDIGPLETCQPTCANEPRRLPVADSMQSADILGSSLGPFALQTELADSIAGLLLRPIDPIACVESSPLRCFPRRSQLPADPVEARSALRCIACPQPSELKEIIPPAGPMPVRPAVFECPEGWTDVSIDTAQFCRPPDRQRLPCPSDQVNFFGHQGCEPVGAVCPAPGNFPATPPMTAAFVRSGSMGGGTQDDPYGTIDQAIAEVAPERTIVLAAGTYPACGLRDRSILGACAAGVILDATGCPGGLLDLSGRTTLDDVTVRGTVFTGSDAEVTVNNVRVDGRGNGCFLVRDGARATASRLVVSACSDAVHVWDAALNAADVIVEDGTVGVGVYSNGNLSVANLIVEDAEYPLLLRDTQNATVSGALLTAREHMNILVEGSRGTLSDIYTETSITATDENLPALHVAAGSTVTVDRAHFRASFGTGVTIDGRDGGKTTVSLTNVAISGVAPAASAGVGIEALGNTDVTLHDVLIEGAEKQGLVHAGLGGFMRVEGLVVLPAGRPIRRGIELYNTTASIERIFITGTASSAITLTRTSADLHDATFVEMLDAAVVLVNQSTLNGDRLRFERVYRVGVYLEQHCTVHLADVLAVDIGTFMSGEGEFSLERAQLFNGSAAFLGNIDVTLTFNDVSLTAVGREGPSVSLLGGVLNMERVAVIDHGNGVVRARGMSSVVMSDVKIIGRRPGDPAIDLTGGPLLGSNAVLSSMEVSGGLTPLRISAMPAQLADVHLSAASVGMELTGTTMVMERFRIDNVNVGISCLGPTTLTAEDGRIDAGEAALRIPKILDLSTALYNVIYEAPTLVEVFP